MSVHAKRVPRSFVFRLPRFPSLDAFYSVAIIFGIVIALEIVWIAFKGPGAMASSADAAAVLGFVTAAAVGIERVVEMVWVMLGNLRGSYWPMNRVGKQITDLVSELDKEMQELQRDASRALLAISNLPPEQVSKNFPKLIDIVTDPAKLEAAQAEIVAVKARFDSLSQQLVHAPTSQRVQLLMAAVDYDVNVVFKKYESAQPQLGWAIGTANRGIHGLQSFAATFKDNPGRRLLSLIWGVVLGLLVAGAFGLDLVSAALYGGERVNSPQLGVIFTGIVIGLGASPTHDAIRALQEIKEITKTRNNLEPRHGERPERA